MRDNLDNVKPGDELILHDSGWGRDEFVVKVERVTATAIAIVGSKSLYRKKDGRVRGESSPWHWSSLRIPAAGELERVRKDMKERQAYDFVRDWIGSHKRHPVCIKLKAIIEAEAKGDAKPAN